MDSSFTRKEKVNPISISCELIEAMYDYGRVQFCPAGVYTIVEVKTGKGSSAGWGRLNSGIGWLSLDFAEKK